MKKNAKRQSKVGEQVQVYALISEASKLDGAHTHPVWRAQVATPSMPRAQPMIIKWLDGHLSLSIELACALAAQCLKLPVPAPALVVAPRKFLPTLPISIKGEHILLIGSEYKNPDSYFAQATSNNPAAEEFVWSKLCASEAGPSGAAWDELVANEDRHYQNALFDGANWWLFDHDRALMSVGLFSKNPDDIDLRSALVNFNAKCNILAAQMVDRHRGNHGISDQANEFSRHKAELSILSAESRKWLHGDMKIQEIFATTAILLTAIELRLPALAQHIQARIEQPSAENLWTSNTD
ncbi:hypothetical protein [Janthinobacterium sp.]|uniref:hypothetical protein n=1 Tax=Janthinobacterium sp. TaxID=1871054 RepID=UPI002DBCEEBE|nr:hypothetical protein [Janthinobacterium sp.]HEU4818327.1 hypothetical protein [Janthinobacterium sp.]